MTDASASAMPAAAAHACFALLDDASGSDTPQQRSRLYTGLVEALRCDDIADWPSTLERMQDALRAGRYAVTVLSYELGGHLLGTGTHASTIALAQVLIFARCQHLAPPEVAAWLAAQADANERPAGIADVRANVDQATFTQALGRIHDYIEAGDTYQVNYTYRLHFDAFGSPPALYARLRARQPVPYGALIALPDGGAILSLSPELFVRHQDGELLARPMKGTAPASDHVDENARRAAALAADAKNRAENLMIVDLLRNDLGRIAVTGTVEVPALFDVQRYSSVLQMTSTVRARLRPDARLEEVFGALYPCGSITGAPKRRTMEIIRELEPAARGVYTGAIGWFDPPAGAIADTPNVPHTPRGSDVPEMAGESTVPDAAHARRFGDFCMSVPIRTLALDPPQRGLRCGVMGVGAGIVFDSDARDEYAECRLKARFLTGLTNDFELFETMRATRDAGCRHLDRHLKRLGGSARYFGFGFDEAGVRAQLAAACAELAGDGSHRLRLALKQDGSVAIVHAPLAALDEPVRVQLADDATLADDIFLRHKTTVRTRYDAAWREAEACGAFDTLFFNERGELTEGGRSNVFIERDGEWLTPPLASGLLPGVMRGAMLDDPAWRARECVITRPMLEAAQSIVVCNALRGAVRAVLATR